MNKINVKRFIFWAYSFLFICALIKGAKPSFLQLFVMKTIPWDLDMQKNWLWKKGALNLQIILFPRDLHIDNKEILSIRVVTVFKFQVESRYILSFLNDNSVIGMGD